MSETTVVRTRIGTPGKRELYAVVYLATWRDWAPVQEAMMINSGGGESSRALRVVAGSGRMGISPEEEENDVFALIKRFFCSSSSVQITDSEE